MKILVSEKQYNRIKSKLISEQDSQDKIIYVTDPKDPKLIYYKKVLPQYNKVKEYTNNWDKKLKELNFNTPNEFLQNLDKNLISCGYKPNTLEFKKVRGLVLNLYNNLIREYNKLKSNPDVAWKEFKRVEPKLFSHTKIKLTGLFISDIKVDKKFIGKKRLTPSNDPTKYRPYGFGFGFTSSRNIGKLPIDIDLTWDVTFEPIKPTEVKLKPIDQKEIKPQKQEIKKTIIKKPTEKPKPEVVKPQVTLTPKELPKPEVVKTQVTQNVKTKQMLQRVYKENPERPGYWLETPRLVSYPESGPIPSKVIYINPKTGEETPYQPNKK